MTKYSTFDKRNKTIQKHKIHLTLNITKKDNSNIVSINYLKETAADDNAKSNNNIRMFLYDSQLTMVIRGADRYRTIYRQIPNNKPMVE